MSIYSKYLCMFGGGAVRGYAYLGAIKAFDELGFYPEKLAGSSVGAVFATLYSLDIPVYELITIMNSVNFELFRDINLNFSSVFSISKGGVLLDWLRDIIEKYYYKDAYKKGNNPPVCFKDLKRDLLILATDLTNSKPFVFSKSTTPDYEVAMAIRASAAMPGLLTPITYDGKLLCDGDIMKSNPAWRLDKNLCPDDLRILELRLEGGKKNTKINNLLDYFNAVYSCITNCSTDFIMDIYSKKDKFDYIKIDTQDLIIVNFNIDKDTRKKLINIGYTATVNFFAHELPQKREMIKNEYENLISKIEEVKKFLLINDIKKTKTAIGDVFELLSDIKKDVDYKSYKEIKKFRYSFIENLGTNFWGKEKLNNKKDILLALENIINVLTAKTHELSDLSLLELAF